MAHRAPAPAAPASRPVSSTAPGQARAERRARQQPAPGSDADTFLASIIRSKVQPPPVRKQTLTRPRLLDWLRDHGSDRLKLIVAEAGYGKTTLLAEHTQRSQVRKSWRIDRLRLRGAQPAIRRTTY